MAILAWRIFGPRSQGDAKVVCKAVSRLGCIESGHAHGTLSADASDDAAGAGRRDVLPVSGGRMAHCRWAQLPKGAQFVIRGYAKAVITRTARSFFLSTIVKETKLYVTVLFVSFFYRAYDILNASEVKAVLARGARWNLIIGDDGRMPGGPAFFNTVSVVTTSCFCPGQDCLDACFNDAIILDPGGRIWVETLNCAGCGACVPICPENRIQLENDVACIVAK